MSTTSRKEREMQAREELILDHAQIMLLEHGFQGLSLDRLASAVEYSKGTLYQHFETKEDLVLAVAGRSMRQRAHLFERGASFQGISRERIFAIGAADAQFVKEYPDFFHVETLLKTTSFWEKTTEKQRLVFGIQAGRCFQTMAAIVRDARNADDLNAPHLSDGQIVFGLIAISCGGRLMGHTPELRVLSAIAELDWMVRANQHTYLDGLPWKPLFHDWNWEATQKKLQKIFPQAGTYLLPEKH